MQIKKKLACAGLLCHAYKMLRTKTAHKKMVFHYETSVSTAYGSWSVHKIIVIAVCYQQVPCMVVEK